MAHMVYHAFYIGGVATQSKAAKHVFDFMGIRANFHTFFRLVGLLVVVGGILGGLLVAQSLNDANQKIPQKVLKVAKYGWNTGTKWLGVQLCFCKGAKLHQSL